MIENFILVYLTASAMKMGIIKNYCSLMVLQPRQHTTVCWTSISMAYAEDENWEWLQIK